MTQESPTRARLSVKSAVKDRILVTRRESRRVVRSVQRAVKAKPSGRPKQPVAVVGIGASAGGLDPCRLFFTGMPTDVGLAFVVVQHLDPDHKSELVSLLGRCTQMPVVEASDRAWVEPNHVYVIPPNRALAINKGRLRVTVPVEKRGARMAIDFFFRSLAAECQERGVGIVFSGTGSDGTLGLQAIKGAGGLTIVQDPQTAQHDGMPRSAIGRGVDFILPVKKIPRELLKYVKHPYVRSAIDPATIFELGNDQLQTILDFLHAHARFDFSSYKHGTLMRRVLRRMNLRYILRFETYVDLLRCDGEEVNALIKDLLICVTHFFREPEAWKLLQKLVIRPLIASKKDDQPIRVWVPGCATGEEAYSLGMLILEEISAAGKTCGVNIFASDVNREVLAIARLGIYPGSIAAEISPQRLSRYFVQEGEHYRIRNQLRDAVVFAEHNLLVDPPFSHLDLITCRNLMIYLESAAQKKLIALFHYSLMEGGNLFLGSAETVGDRHDLFRAVSRKFRIYKWISAQGSEAVEFPLDAGRPRSHAPATILAQQADTARFTELAQQFILNRWAPASVVVNHRHEILYTCGKIEQYVKQPVGIMHTDLLPWLNESVRSKLRNALREARNGRVVMLSAVRMHRGDAASYADISVEPLKAPRLPEGLLFITFHPSQRAAHAAANSTKPQPLIEDESMLRQLEDELKTTREDLQSNIDQLAASNNELNVSKGEIVSGNEELQSSNEELETSKEELQSLNEELSTVNTQLNVKVDELETKTNDLNNLLVSTEIATVFLDSEFHIKWFTAPATGLLKLRSSDIGRPIGDLAMKFTGRDLLLDTEQVLRKSVPVEREVCDRNGRWYLRRVLPYQAAGNRIEGLVITFVDIHSSKLAEENLRRMAAVLRDCNDAVTVQDFDGGILAWNHGAEVMYGYTEKEALRRNALNLTPRSGQAEMRKLFARLKRGEEITPHEIQRKTKEGKILDVWLTISALMDDEGNPTAIATTERDITQRKRDETALRELNESLESRIADRNALAEQLRKLAAQLLVTEEQERRNLAADLHDNLSQILHVAKLKLSELKSAKDKSGLYGEIENLLVRANQSARSLSYQLSPPVLYELGLNPALEWLSEEMNRLYRLQVSVTRNHYAALLDERAHIILFRAVRELLVNVAKHAGVRHASVRIRRKGGRVILSVEDHGVGFDPKLAHDPKKTRGMGLFSIRERLEYIGGSMQIRSIARKTTTINLGMPIPGERQRD